MKTVKEKSNKTKPKRFEILEEGSGSGVQPKVWALPALTDLEQQNRELFVAK